MRYEANKREEHRQRPVRNFFYTLYSLLNAAAFSAFFYLLFTEERQGEQTALMIGAGILVAFGVIFGIIRPLLRK